MRTTIFALVLLAAPALFGATEPPENPRSEEARRRLVHGYVRGNDNRVAQMSGEYPWSAVGQITKTERDGKSYTCTGTLVRDDLVVTNAHCVLDRRDGRVPGPIRFQPNLRGGISRHESYSSHVWNGTELADDWAIVRLRSPLGQDYGRFGVKTPGIDDLASEAWSGRVNLPGYAGDFMNGDTAGVHIGCSVLRDAGLLGFVHDCDMNSGASGGPIFGLWNDGPYLIGLNYGHTPENNYGVYASKFVGKLREVIRSEEGKTETTFVHLCNLAVAEPIAMSVAYWNGSGWTSRGWYQARYGECREIPIAARYNGDVYVHATNFRGLNWGGGPTSFCVSAGAGYEQSNADKQCPSGRRARFSPPWRVTYGAMNTHPFRR